MRIIGLGVCGPNEASRYMRKTMEEFKRLCDDVIIVTNNATDKEKDLIKEYGFWQYEDNREWGIHQPDIKTDLLNKIAKLNPDWVIAMDMDEVFAPEFTRKVAEEYTNKNEVAWHFFVINFYNDKEHFAHDVGIQRFWNIRFFKFLPEFGLQYQRKSLHCGLAPPFAYKFGWYAPFYLEHYGLMRLEDRMKRVERYQKYDPNGKFKDPVYYNDLKRELRMYEFNSEKLLKQLKESRDCQKRIPPKIISKQ